MKVVSIGEIDHDGTNYAMWLQEPWTQAVRKLQVTERESADPLVARARTQPVTHQLEILLRPGVAISEASAAPLREALLAELDTEDEAIALVVSDDDDTNARYLMVVCQAVDAQPDGIGHHYVATLVSHGDPRWRADTASTTAWAVTASGQTTAISNGGSLPARPTYTFKPTANKSGVSGNYYEYAVFKAVTWTSPNPYRQYPVSITGKAWDTDALITGGKITAETNIGVVVDGKEVRRWIDDYNSATTDVWVNLDFSPSARTRLLTSFGSGDSVSTIYAAQGIGAFPQQGILLIGSEVFSYDGKDDLERTFLNVSRAAKGTTAADHTGGSGETGDAIYWIQHEVWIVYGGTGTAQTTFDDDAPDTYWYIGYDGRKPMLDLPNSSNFAWNFDNFGQDGLEYRYRSASWTPFETPGHTADPVWTGASESTDPYDELLIGRVNASAADASGDGSWWALNIAYPFEQLFASGTAAYYEATRWSVYMDDGSGVVLQVPQPSSINADEAFSETETNVSRSYPTQLRWIQRCAGAMEARLDICTVTFSEYPVVTTGTEIDTYSLSATLENVTTGESLTVTLQMAVDEQLQVDTTNHTVTLLDDNTNQYQALSLSSRRREILTLLPGSNTLKLTELGLAGMTVTVSFEERTYS